MPNRVASIAMRMQFTIVHGSSRKGRVQAETQYYTVDSMGSGTRKGSLAASGRAHDR